MNIYDVNYVLQNFIYLTRNLLYTMLTCIELHTAQLLFHVDIKIEHFRRADDDAFFHDIICESGEDAEYDGSQYLNDTGEGDADQSEQMAAQDDTVEVSIEIRTYMYMQNFMMNSVPTNVQRV